MEMEMEMHWIGLGGEKDGNGNKRKITLREDDVDQTNNNRAYIGTLIGSIGLELSGLAKGEGCTVWSWPS